MASNARFKTVRITETTDSLAVGVAPGAAPSTASGEMYIGTVHADLVETDELALDGGLAVGGGAASDEGVVIPDGVPAVTTANLHNDGGVLTWPAGTIADSVGSMATIRAGGIGIASQAQYDTAYASSATQWARLANGTTGQVLTATTNGAPSWAAPTSPLDLLYSNSGTVAGAGGARTIDWVALTGLTVRDILELELDIIKVGGTSITIKFTNTTDSVDITTSQSANANAHTVFSHRVSAGPISLTDVQSSGRRTAGGTITNNAVASTFTTNWTGNWTTGLIVDSGDGTSVDWVVRIYKRKGQ
jgi:hypothetical protein